jgi:protein-S-isoprenylcysteine O-methyltransferase Ste14
MPDLIVDAAIAGCWGSVVVVWIAGGIYNARFASRGRIRDRSGMPVFVGVAAIGAAAIWVGYGYLHDFVFEAVWAQLFGLAILAVAAVFAIWARVTLGRMWSSTPQVGAERKLRTEGPYGVTRHPIYSGLFGMLVGTTLLAGGHELIAVVVVAFVLFEVKIAQEERLMVATFPDEYPAYRHRVPQIVPGLRLPRGGRM